MQQTSTMNNSASFELKGSMVTLTVMHLLKPELEAFSLQLADNVRKTPNLFKKMPIVVDLAKIKASSNEINLDIIIDQLRHHDIVPVAIRNGSEEHHQAAQRLGLAVLVGDLNNKKEKSTLAIPAYSNQIITKAVRSGQQIYARNANLIVLSSVSNGAELLADGNIHVYGVLRGRALAGMSGDKTSRIFCQKLEAELVSIAGFYKLKDDINVKESTAITQIYLENEEICIETVGNTNLT